MQVKLIDRNVHYYGHFLVDPSVPTLIGCPYQRVEFRKTVSRVRTDFWIQNSRLFPDFFQTNNLFFQTQGYQTSERQEQNFFHDALQTYR